MPYCPNCGKELSSGARFCSRCGADQQTHVSSAAPDASAAPTRATQNMSGASQANKQRKAQANTRVGWIVLLCTSLAVIVIAAFVLVVRSQPASGDASQDSQASNTQATANTQGPSAQKDSSADKPQDTDAQNQTTADKQTENAADAEEQAKAAQDAEHERLRNEAAAAGKQVLEGTLRILSGEEVSTLDGTPLNANGPSVAEKWRNARYAYLMFDGNTTVNNVAYDIGTVSRDVDHVCLGEQGDIRNTMGSWPNYDGQRVCVACTGFAQSDGVSLVTCPFIVSNENAELLYVADEGSATPAPATSTPATTQADALVAIYETDDFIVSVPADWVGSCYAQPYEDGAHIFGRTWEKDSGNWIGQSSFVVPFADASGRCESLGVSSAGNEVLLLRGKNGFFDNGATVTVK